MDDGDGTPTANTALIDGVRKYAMDVKSLDIDLIDRINPFGGAYAILAKTMEPERYHRNIYLTCRFCLLLPQYAMQQSLLSLANRWMLKEKFATGIGHLSLIADILDQLSLLRHGIFWIYANGSMTTQSSLH